eukprot:Skav226112  [mRNA]  locus=scaffold702:224569:228730:- [translate_table: standard]
MNRDVHMMIEKDAQTAQVCAKAFGCQVFTAKEYIEKVLKHEQIQTCVIHDTIENPKTWMAIALSNPEAILASPPCQPWSSAGHGLGLSSDDGQAMSALLGWAGLIGVSLVVVENVPGLRKHSDYPTIIKEAKSDGMEPVLADVYQCAPVLPVKRERWLAAFVHCTVTVQNHRIQLAAAISFTDHLFHAVCRSPSLRQADVIHCNMSSEERKELEVTEKMMDALGNPNFVPKWLAKDIKWNCKSEAIVEARTTKPQQQMGTIMAMYGKQHELGQELLQTKGLHATLIEDSKGKRLFSPWEVVAALGYPATTIMHRDLDKAFLLAGNGLSVAHAWLALYKVHILLGSNSPFKPQGSQVDQVSQLLGNMIKLSEYQTEVHDDQWILVKISHDDAEHLSKKPRVDISTTLAFEIDSALATKAFNSAPPFECCHDPRVISVKGLDYSDGLVVLAHIQNHWVMMINIAKGQTVGNAIEKGLPHAKPMHFETIQVNGIDVKWDQSLNANGQQRVVFSPTPVLISCCEQSLDIALTLSCDVTWTAKNGKAYCAARMGCQVDAFDLLNDGRKVLEDDYLLEFNNRDFNIVFKTTVPHYVDVSSNAKDINDLDIRVAPASYTRFFAKHPLKKTIRTISMPINCTLSQMMQELFLDMHASTAWTVFGEGQSIPKDAYINAWKSLQIQWETMRPIPVTDVQVIRYNNGLDSAIIQTKLALTGIKRWCRSPFAVKPVEVLVPPDMTIGELAATYMCHTVAQATLLCSIDGVLLDPELKLSQTRADCIIQTRICPMLGGAKHDGLKKRIKDMLSQKGVPDDQLSERLSGFLAQCPLEKIAVHKDNNDDQLWQNLKSLATSAKYRLIKPDELKAFQAKMKQNKAGPSNPVKKDAPKGKMARTKHNNAPAAQDVIVDPSHFAAEGDPVSILEFERFREPRGLARKQGAPIVITVALIQYGDTDIDFVLQIPAVTVNQETSMVVEFTIERKHVPQWNATQIPMHYLGVHCSPLRGNNLLAVWSVKAWAGQKLSQHASATHWHGFIRVSDNLLTQILSRSVNAGIFMCPKTIAKRHDPRCSAISIPTASLQEALAKAESTPNVLGVVKMGESFASRCKREHTAGVRSHLMPETAYVDMANIDMNDKLYILRHVPLINREELTQALKNAGWTAQAIKPQGPSRWIVASQQEAPASHLAINNDIVIIEKMNDHRDVQPPTLVATAREVRVDTIRDAGNNVVSTTTTTRIAEMRAQIEEQVASVIDARLEAANNQIQQLSQALQDVQRDNVADMTHLKNEQEHTKKKLNEMEQAVALSGQSIVKQMQQMFATMEENLTTKMETAVESAVANITPIDNPEKRRKENGDQAL